jgi:putative membrane protein
MLFATHEEGASEMKIIIKYGRIAALAAGVSALLGVTGLHIVSAQSPAMSQPADSTFALEAASGGMAEVKLGQLAQARGTSEAVTAFGKRMEMDHSKADAQLKEIASKENISLPTSLNSEDQTTYDRLSKLSGAEFDRAYSQQMVQDHRNDIAAFKKEASSGENAELKNFASQTLPTLQQHLQAAQAMSKTVNASSSGH